MPFPLSRDGLRPLRPLSPCRAMASALSASQLVVITHDEDFVQLIGRGENCSHYYWVEKKFMRDGDPPCSTITKKSIDRFG